MLTLDGCRGYNEGMWPDPVLNPGPLALELDRLRHVAWHVFAEKDEKLSLNYPQYPLLSGALRKRCKILQREKTNICERSKLQYSGLFL